MTYKEIQAALKELRSTGTEVRVKLNAKKDDLQAEYLRLMSTTTTTTTEDVVSKETTVSRSQFVAAFNVINALPDKNNTDVCTDGHIARCNYSMAPRTVEVHLTSGKRYEPSPVGYKALAKPAVTATYTHSQAVYERLNRQGQFDGFGKAN